MLLLRELGIKLVIYGSLNCLMLFFVLKLLLYASWDGIRHSQKDRRLELSLCLPSNDMFNACILEIFQTSWVFHHAETSFLTLF